MLSEFGIIEVDPSKKEWNEIKNYKKRKFAEKFIMKLARKNPGLFYYLCWYNFPANTDHCIHFDSNGNQNNSDVDSIFSKNRKGNSSLKW